MLEVVVDMSEPDDLAPAQSLFAVPAGGQLRVGRGSVCNVRSRNPFLSRVSMLLANRGDQGNFVVAFQKAPGSARIRSAEGTDVHQVSNGSNPVRLRPGHDYTITLHVPEKVAQLTVAVPNEHGPAALRLFGRDHSGFDAETITRWHPRLTGTVGSNDWIDVVALGVMLDRYPELRFAKETMHEALKRVCALSRGTASATWVNSRLDQAYQAAGLPDLAKGANRLSIVIHHYRDAGIFTQAQLAQLRELAAGLESVFPASSGLSTEV